MRTMRFLPVMAAVGLAIEFVSPAGAAPWQKSFERRGVKSVWAGNTADKKPVIARVAAGQVLSLALPDAAQGAPRIKQLEYMPLETKLRTPLLTLDYGPIGRGPGSGRPEVTGDWAHTMAKFGDELMVVASRLSPGMLITVSGESLTLFSGGLKLMGRESQATMPLRGVAYPCADGVRTSLAAPDMPSALDSRDDSMFAAPERPWILLWWNPFPYTRAAYGDQGLSYMAHSPVLLVFSTPPFEVEFDEGVTFSWLEPGPHHAVLIPLYGSAYPDEGQVAVWANGLPDDVAGRCEWWNETLGCFPLTVEETYEFERGDGAIMVDNAFSYVELREHSAPHAPVPPMLVLAKEMGLPVTFEGGGYEDSGLVTPFGPYCVVRDAARVRARFDGLAKYALEDRAIPDPALMPGDLLDEFIREIDAILAAGHLAPWRMVVRDVSFPDAVAHGAAQFEWDKPGDMIETLAGAMPLLDDKRRAEAAAYMARQRNEFPPESLPHLPYDAGARRERHFVSDEFIRQASEKREQRSFYTQNKSLPMETLYALDCYYKAIPGAAGELEECWDDIRAAAEPYLAQLDWASLGFSSFNTVQTGKSLYDKDVYFGAGGVLEANAWVKAMIGYVRLARRAGDPGAEAEAWGLLARALAFRYALGKYALFQYRRGLLPDPRSLKGEKTIDNLGSQWDTPWNRKIPFYVWEFRDELDYVAQPMRVDEFGVESGMTAPSAYPGFFRIACPELGRFCSDFLRPEFSRLLERIEENLPDWHIAFNTDGFNFSDAQPLQPFDSHQVFLAMAWVAEAPPERLRVLRDVPWVARGDLYYLDKLRETLYSYARATWQPEKQVLSHSKKTNRE